MRVYLGPLGLLFLVHTFLTTAVFTVPVFAVVAARDIGVSAVWIGVYPALVFSTAMFAAIAGGAMTRRFGGIGMSQLCLIVCATGLLLMASASLPLMVLGAIFIGAGLGPAAPAASHLLAPRTPARLHALVFSLKHTGAPLGTALAGMVVPPLVISLGWQGTSLAMAAPCLALVAIAEPLRRRLDAESGTREEVSVAMTAPLRMLFSDPRLRTIALVVLPFATVQICIGIYFVPYFVEKMGMSLVEAGRMLAVAQGAGAVGRIAWGHLAGRFMSPGRTLALLGILVAVFASLTALFTDAWPLALVVAVSAALGATANGWNGVFLAEVARCAPSGRVSEATGAATFVVFAGVAGGPPLFGALVAVAGYAAGFLTIAAASLSGGLLAMLHDRDSNRT